MVLYKIYKHSISINGLYHDLDFHFVLKLQYYATLLCYACRVWNVLVTFQKPIIQGLWLIAVYDNRSGLLLQSCCRVFVSHFQLFLILSSRVSLSFIILWLYDSSCKCSTCHINYVLFRTNRQAVCNTIVKYIGQL